VDVELSDQWFGILLQKLKSRMIIERSDTCFISLFLQVKHTHLLLNQITHRANGIRCIALVVLTQIWVKYCQTKPLGEMFKLHYLGLSIFDPNLG